MPKKVIKGNPALQFLSLPESEDAPQTENVSPDSGEQISPLRETEPHRMKPMFIETKSRRLQLIIRPSLYERIKSGANMDGISVNEYIHNILDKATDINAEEN